MRQNNVEQIFSPSQFTHRDQQDEIPFGVLLDHYLDETQLSTEQFIAGDWFEKNHHLFPFLNQESIQPPKFGEADPDLIITFLSHFKFLSALIAPEIMIDIIRTSPADNLRATPRSGEYLLFYNEKPDHSFFNAQFILQILIATKVFPSRELWSDIFRVINPQAVQDFFSHFSKLSTFAKYNLMGEYPKGWFQLTHPRHAELNLNN